MKFTFSWLKEHIDLNKNISVNEVVSKLISIGIEVENISELYDGFIVAQIVECAQHPNADKLKVCKVNDGKSVRNIVCGASNVSVGLRTVLASSGCIIPLTGKSLEPSKIRGVASQGMMCSAIELCVEGAKDDGTILELDQKSVIGNNYPVGDPVIDITVTPNRGDLLSVRGIARDLAASGLGTLKMTHEKYTKLIYQNDTDFELEINDDSAMLISSISGVDNQIESPKWLMQRLNSIGMKTISPLVDITNYLTVDIGHPMHVYDADKLHGSKISVCNDFECEFLALDGNSYNIKKGMKVVVDAEGPQSIAGIIGGLTSSCSLDTKNVLLEIGFFDPVSICKTGRELSIFTESRYRGERGIDYGFMESALYIALGMIINICSGVGKKPQIILPHKPLQEIRMSKDYVFKISGMSLNQDYIDGILSSLGFDCRERNYSIPTWRHDIQGSADLVEEVLRIHGYDKIPEEVLVSEPILKKADVIDQVKEIMMRRGIYEVITWSFMSSDRCFNSPNQNMFLVNPVNKDLDVMRTSLIPNLLDIVQKNRDRSQQDISIFELGDEYHDANDVRRVIAGIRAGMMIDRNIHCNHRFCDVYDIKADLMSIIEVCYNLERSVSILQGVAPDYYHPGRSAAVKLGKNVLGYFGQIHPSQANDVFGFELFLDKIPKTKKKFKEVPLSVYQPVRRDFAFIIDKNIPSDELIKAVYLSNKNIIESVEIFDVYVGKDIGDNKKSIAFSVVIQSYNKSLTKNEIDEISNSLCISVNNRVGGNLRDGSCI